MTDHGLVFFFILMICYISESSIQIFNFKPQTMEPDEETNSYMKTVTTTSKSACAVACSRLPDCHAFLLDVHRTSCQLFNTPWVFQSGIEFTQVFVKDWCPEDFNLLAAEGPCIKFHSDVLSWYNARDTCTTYSPMSRLAILDTEQKFNLVREAGIAVNHLFHSGLWIGLSDVESPGQHSWVNGNQVGPYTAWSTFNNTDPDQAQCVGLIRVKDWRWSASKCPLDRHYVCEIVPLAALL